MSTQNNIVFNDYTYNNGNCAIHKACMSPENHKKILDLMSKGKGDWSYVKGATYDFREYRKGVAGLSVDYQGVPAYISIFCPSAAEIEFAFSNLDETAQYFRQHNLPCDRKLFLAKPPCNITLIIPSIMMIPLDIIKSLGNVPGTFAEVWLNKVFGSIPPE